MLLPPTPNELRHLMDLRKQCPGRLHSSLLAIPAQEFLNPPTDVMWFLLVQRQRPLTQRCGVPLPTALQKLAQTECSCWRRAEVYNRLRPMVIGLPTISISAHLLGRVWQHLRRQAPLEYFSKCIRTVGLLVPSKLNMQSHFLPFSHLGLRASRTTQHCSLDLALHRLARSCAQR